MDVTRKTHEPAGPALDVPGRIEVRGIDFVPPGERHGRPRELFWIWMSANVTYLYFVLGGTMIMLGLSLPQALAVVVVGNLLWLGVGYLAISGPASGTPAVVVTRAMFGIRANRVLSAGMGWVVAVAYEAVNLALAALAGFALVSQLGLGDSFVIQALVFVVVAVVTFTLSIYGHATIARVSPYFSVVLAVVMIVLGAFVVSHADWSYAPTDAPVGVDLTATILIGIAIIAAVPLSWQTGADYSRYLPERTSAVKVMTFTALGGFVPAVVLCVVGVIAGTSIDMTDAQTAVADIVPGWFYPLFLAVVVFGSVTNNVLTAYSSGLCLQSMGLKATRARTVFIDAVLASIIAVYALTAENFLDQLSGILETTVAMLAPAMTIYVIDIAMRRNRYDGIELNDERPGSRYWYRGGFNLGGTIAMIVGTLVGALSLSTTLWTGPLASALDGADVSLFAGAVVTGVLYLALWRVSDPHGTRHRGKVAA